jgi:peptide/nickel transport system substrate-binding protein
MYQVYHSDSTSGAGSNHYRIRDSKLDEEIINARKSDNKEYRKACYKDCLDIILDWAVEVPTYQRKNFVCFSTERIVIDSIAKDCTPFYTWDAEIDKIEINK